MIDDFGFTFESDSEAVSKEAADKQTEMSEKIVMLENQLQILTKNNREMFHKVMVLLNNLKKSPEKPNIHWPKRVEAIDAFIAELTPLATKPKIEKE